MKLYRVIAWDPVSGDEYNVGLFIAQSRDDAIRQAESKRPEKDAMVLDAALSFGA